MAQIGTPCHDNGSQMPVADQGQIVGIDNRAGSGATAPIWSVAGGAKGEIILAPLPRIAFGAGENRRTDRRATLPPPLANPLDQNSDLAVSERTAGGKRKPGHRRSGPAARD